MKKLLVRTALSLICCCTTLFTFAQLTRDWAKNGGGGGLDEFGLKTDNMIIDIATDKHGNTYTLGLAEGYVQIDGHTTIDSNTQMVLVSWDCNGNFRWMKSFGVLNNTNSVIGEIWRLTVDTMEGVYLSGNSSIGTQGSLYIDTDTVLYGNLSSPQNDLVLIKYNSLGTFQWLKTPALLPSGSGKGLSYGISAMASGYFYWFAYLPAGTYDGGAYNISAPGYYVIAYNTNGVYQNKVKHTMAM